MSKRLTLYCVLVVLLMSQFGCGILDTVFLSPPEDTPRDLAEAGYTSMEEKDYKDAIEYFTKLKDRYPFSPYTTKAELALADAYFLNGNYLIAEETYKEFESLHPRHESLPYVLLQVGMSNYEQFSSIDRPQENIEEAVQYFKRLREVAPDSRYAVKAEKYIDKCRRVLAEHELFIANFYWRRDNYGSAWKRYSYVVEHFKDLPEIHEFAYKRSQQAYMKYQISKSERRLEEEKGSWKEWFDWL